LYSTSILLAVGVFEMFSLFSWGGNLLSSTMKTEKLIESVESIVHSLTLGFGIFFSAILAILFIPLLLLQRSKIRELVHGDEKWRSKWLTTQGLPSSLMTMAGEVVALIIPFVTSLISNLGNWVGLIMASCSRELSIYLALSRLGRMNEERAFDGMDGLYVGMRRYQFVHGDHYGFWTSSWWERSQGKGAKYTKHRGPFTVVFTEFQETRGQAVKREAEIQSMKREEKFGLIETR